VIASPGNFNGFLVGMAISGLGFGVLVAVDSRWRVDVLPDQENEQRNLGCSTCPAPSVSIARGSRRPSGDRQRQLRRAVRGGRARAIRSRRHPAREDKKTGPMKTTATTRKTRQGALRRIGRGGFYGRERRTRGMVDPLARRRVPWPEDRCPAVFTPAWSRCFWCASATVFRDTMSSRRSPGVQVGSRAEHVSSRALSGSINPERRACCHRSCSRRPGADGHSRGRPLFRANLSRRQRPGPHPRRPDVAFGQPASPPPAVMQEQGDVRSRLVRASARTTRFRDASFLASSAARRRSSKSRVHLGGVLRRLGRVGDRTLGQG